MGKGAFIGVDVLARKIKGGYIGIDGVARKIVSAYIGVGGVARPCWGGGGELSYYGTAEALSVARRYLAATSVGDYALFGGGYDGSYSSTVDAYNSALARTTPTALSLARRYLAATSIGDYALFAGGSATDENNSVSSIVDAYNSALVRSTPTELSVARRDLTATSVGNYALFSGGTKNYYSGGLNVPSLGTVDAYMSALVRSTPTALSVARRHLAAASVGDYALFGGGYSPVMDPFSDDTDYKNVVDAYNSALARTTPTALSVARYNLAATSVGDYALFGGGYGSAYSNTVDAYTSALVRSTPTALSVARRHLAAASVGDYALFGGGYGSNDTYSNVVDAYTVA